MPSLSGSVRPRHWVFATALAIWALFFSDSAAFAKTKGFGAAKTKGFDAVPQRSGDVIDNESRLVEAEVVSSDVPQIRRKGVDVLIAGGGVAGLWLALLLSSSVGRKVSRVRVFEPKLRRDSASDALRWKKDRERSVYREEVVTVAGHVWSAMPKNLQSRLFPEGGYSEQFPASHVDRSKLGGRDQMAWPRNVALGDLEDRLLELAQERSLNILAEHYGSGPHSELLKKDPFDVVVFADGPNAEKACEEVAQEGFGNLVPRDGDRDESLGLPFELEEAKLSLAATAALSMAQRRYLLSWTGPGRGVLQLRLTAEEALALDEQGHSETVEIAELQQLTLWQEVLEACKVFGLEAPRFQPGLRLASDSSDRPAFTAVLPDSKKSLVACLLGSAACRGSADCGPGFGAGALLEGAQSLAQALLANTATAYESRVDLDKIQAHGEIMKRIRDRHRQAAFMGLPEAIASGLAQPDPKAQDIFLQNLKACFEKLSEKVSLPPQLQQELPSWEELKNFVCSANLSSRTFAAMAASGPRPEETNEDTDKTDEEWAEEARKSLQNLGGATPDGLKRAKELEDMAKEGNTNAQLELGCMYITSDGVDKDESKAFQLMLQSAEGGLSEAMSTVGFLYRHGIGCDMRKDEAIQWYEKAHAAGDVYGTYNLGELLFLEKRGSIQDRHRGLLLLEEAANRGVEMAQYHLALELSKGTNIKRDMSRAIDLMRGAANAGSADACCTLGRWCFEGQGMKPDKAEASKYYQKAAELGEATSMYHLGCMFEQGDGVPKSDAQAQHWFRQAASTGILEAQAKCKGQFLLAPPT